MPLMRNAVKEGGVSDFYPHKIDQSLRFNDDDSAYLSRTPALGDTRQWVYSTWVKRGNLGTNQNIFAASPNSSNRVQVSFQAGTDKIQFLLAVANVYYGIRSNEVFRDPSSWYHIFAVFDTNNATAAERMRVFVNGVEITSDGGYSQPAQFTDGHVNKATEHRLGLETYSNILQFDGNLSKTEFVSGLIPPVTDFGEFKNGVWIPKAYTGSYGTNGFHLDFADSGNIGNDVSGNNNDWTPVNLAATDVLLDSPTNKFATLNPLDKASTISLSEGNTYATVSTTQASVYPTMFVNSGKWYAEYNIITASNMLGIGKAGNPTSNYLGAFDDNFGYNWNGDLYTGAAVVASGSALSVGDIISVVLDMDALEISFYRNNTFQLTVPITDTRAYYGFAVGHSNQQIVVNFGQDSSFAGNKTRQNNTDANGIGDFYYPVPTGALALCANNLPEPAIGPNSVTLASDHFNPVAYTGQVNPYTIDAGFPSDLTSIKCRSVARLPVLFDSLRGANSSIVTADTSIEDSNWIGQSFTPNGLVVDNTYSGETNFAGDSYIAWNWRMGGAGVVNNDGSIQSTVSANTLAGQSIVTYTGNQTPGDTVGHGLLESPEFIISKSRGNANGWPVYHTTLGGTQHLRLNTTGTALANAIFWNNTDPTSSVFTLGANDENNTSGQPIIAYCYHSVEGYSKFGKYTGNGSTDGTFVYLGFKPAYVRIKRVDSTGNWPIIDSVRSPDNETSEALYADLANAEDPNVPIDFLSNGVKIRTSFNNANTNGGAYIIEAFAEVPFKYSTAV